jgi:hypothetical protein
MSSPPSPPHSPSQPLHTNTTLKPYQHYKHNQAVWLNVGGTYFQTLVSTLTSKSGYFQSFAAAELDESENGATKQTAIFIDRDPDLFKYILSYLRNEHYQFPVNELANLRHEFEYYRIAYPDPSPIRATPSSIVQVHNKYLTIHSFPFSDTKLLNEHIAAFNRNFEYVYQSTSDSATVIGSLKLIESATYDDSRVLHIDNLHDILISMGYTQVKSAVPEIEKHFLLFTKPMLTLT